jgi:predicted MPP superfamily phosphohydrolase
MPNHFFLVLYSCTILDALFLIFFLTRTKELHASRLLLAALFLLLITAVRAPLLSFFWFSLFGVIHVAYLDLVVVVPLLSGLLLLSSWRGRLVVKARLKLGLFFLGVSPVLLAIYASFIELDRTQLELPNIALNTKRAGKQPLKIGVLSDIQTSSIDAHELDAIQRLLAQEPDIILIAGDLFQGSNEDFEASLDDFHTMLNSLKAPGGVYFVEGDAEQWRRTPRLLEGTIVQYLYNETKTITVKDRKVSLLGLELMYSSDRAKSAMYTLQNMPEEGDIRIILSHRPDSVLFLPESSRIDLVVSGHTHGGQIQIPLIGPLLTLTDVPRWVAAGGAHKLNNNAIYVSRGLGYEGGQAPPIRFLCPPEVAVLTIDSQ